MEEVLAAIGAALPELPDVPKLESLGSAVDFDAGACAGGCENGGGGGGGKAFIV
jgi:hypothetical protein